jgi:PilZ domain
MSSENRRYRRVRVRSVAASVRAPGVLEETHRVYCPVETLSMGGMFVRTDRLLKVGTLLQISLGKRGWQKPLELRGLVSNLQERSAAEVSGMGVRFVGLSPAQQESLKELVARAAAEAGVAPAERQSLAEPLSVARPAQVPPSRGLPAIRAPERPAGRLVPPPVIERAMVPQPPPPPAEALAAEGGTAGEADDAEEVEIEAELSAELEVELVPLAADPSGDGPP